MTSSADLLTPLFPWIGGKRTLKKKLLEYIPSSYGTYYEPFLGAGSVFLLLRPSRAVVNDINPWVIMIYHAVRSHFTEFMELLEMLRKGHQTPGTGGEPFFYKCVESFNTNKKNVQEQITSHFPSSGKCNCTQQILEKTALFYFITKYAFGAKLWYKPDDSLRCTYSKHDSMPAYCPKRFKKVSDYLKSCDLTMFVGDYAVSLKSCKKGDFVYMDPPYFDSDFDNNIARYSQVLFDNKCHTTLKKCMDNLTKKGVHVVQSNASSEGLLKLYDGYDVRLLRARRNLSYENKQSKGKNECVITNADKLVQTAPLTSTKTRK